MAWPMVGGVLVGGSKGGLVRVLPVPLLPFALLPKPWRCCSSADAPKLCVTGPSLGPAPGMLLFAPPLVPTCGAVA